MRYAAALTALLSFTACSPAPAAPDEANAGKPKAAKSGSKNGAKAGKAAACRVERFEGVGLTVCTADPARHRIAMALGPKCAPKGTGPYRHLAILAASRPPDAPSVAFAMNGGMFDEDGQPIGYYVEDGARLHKLNRNEGPGNFHMLPNGVFYGTGQAWAVSTTDDFANAVTERPDFATQSGPMLVIDGRLHPEIAADGVSTNIRNGVGVGRDGRAYFVISEGPLSFGKFARYFRDALKVPNALYLDGKVSSLWDPAHGRLDNMAPLGPLIVVEQSGKGSP